MRIRIQSKQGRTLGDKTPQGCLGLLAVVLSVIFAVFLLKSNQFQGSWFSIIWDKAKVHNSNGTLNVVELLKHSLKVFLVFIAYILLIARWIPVFKNIVAHYLYEPLARKNLYFLFKKKIDADLNNTTVSSSDDLQESTYQLYEESHFLEEAAKNHPLNTVKELWHIKKSDLTSSISDNIIRNIPGAGSAIKDSYRESKRKIVTKLKSCDAPQDMLDLYIAKVQPYFYLAAKQLIREIKIPHVFNVRLTTETGVGTVKKSTSEAFNRPTSLNINTPQPQASTSSSYRAITKNSIIGFIAPLSAYISTDVNDSNNKAINPNDYFQPVVKLTEEEQQVLFLEGYTSILKTSRKLYYLDDSTAEEHILKVGEGFIKSGYTPVKVSSFSNYKRLLRGKVLSDGTILEPGDGIVLWSPLTSFFENYTLPTGTLKLPDKEQPPFIAQSRSSIALFIERQGAMNNKSEDHFEILSEFFYALSLKISIDHAISAEEGLFSKMFKITRIPWYYLRFLRDHKSTFTDLFK